jgi:hypothetical protein
MEVPNARGTSAASSSQLRALGTGPRRGRRRSRRRGCRGGSRRIALASPRRPRSCAWWAARQVPLVRAAAFADSVSASVSHFGPGRVRPDCLRPADSRLPGQTPAQDARCLTVGKPVMSSPHSAISTCAVRTATPGIVHSSSTIFRCGASIASTFSSSVTTAASSVSPALTRVRLRSDAGELDPGAPSPIAGSRGCAR